MDRFNSCYFSLMIPSSSMIFPKLDLITVVFVVKKGVFEYFFSILEVPLVHQRVCHDDACHLEQLCLLTLVAQTGDLEHDLLCLYGLFQLELRGGQQQHCLNAGGFLLKDLHQDRRCLFQILTRLQFLLRTQDYLTVLFSED